MNRSILQLTLRELQVLVQSLRFWMTFGTVVCLFTITGPFGTLERMALVPRFGYWLVLHTTTWAIAILCIVVSDILLSRRVESLLVRILLGGLAACGPIGFAVSLIRVSVFGGSLSWANIAGNIADALPLTLVFCVLTWMTMSREMAAVTAQAVKTADISGETLQQTTPPLLDRLKPETRGTILRLSAEDHYTLVETSRGRALVLVRFADALKELGGADGMQVHRSHWVARKHVAGIKRENGKMLVVLNDGSLLPVSRTHAGPVRAAFR